MKIRPRAILLATLSTSVVGVAGCAFPGFEGSELERGDGIHDDEGDEHEHNGTDIGMDGDEGDFDQPGDDDDDDPDSPLRSVRAAVTMKAACPTDARISQSFRGGHDGVDLANKKGTPIFAVAAGVVTASGPAKGYGQWIRIKHDDGSMTEYGHMYRRDVAVGARVTAGQRIALMGSEGKSTGPHLHLRTYRSAKKTGSGNGMNPAEYLRARGVTIPCKPGTSGGVTASTPDGSFTVSVWKGADVRSPAQSDAPVVGAVEANTTYVATCWKQGDLVESDGYTNDRWIKLTAGGVTGFVSGIFLRGDKTGGVPTQCK